MAELTHLHKPIAARATETSSTLTTKLTVTAAELSSAGFATNDHVLILVWCLLSTDDNATHAQMRVTYNGIDLDGHSGLGVPMEYDCAGTDVRRNVPLMHRVDLGATIQDIDIDLASSDGSNTVGMDLAEILVLKLADFGTEGVDWFWDESTTQQNHDNTFTATNQAAITWTPDSVENWVVIGCTQTGIKSTQKRHEYQIDLDSGTLFGDASEEGENADEEKSWLLFTILNSLSAASHTIENKVRDDPATGSTNSTRESRLFIFRAAIFSDLYADEAGTVSVTNDTDTQVATVTDTMSTAQNALILGMGTMNPMGASGKGYMWVRQGGSTVIDPVTDFTGSGLTNLRSYDNDSENLYGWMGYKNLSGTLDLDLFNHQDGTASKDLQLTTLLVWGLDLAAAAVQAPASTARAAWQTAGDALVEILAPASTTRAGWKATGTGAVEILAPAATARVGWRTTGSAVVDVEAPTATARAAWQPTGFVSPEVEAPASTARAGWKTSAVAITDLQGAATARTAWQANAAAVTDVQGTAVARVGWRASGAAITDVQATSSTTRAAWKPTGAGDIEGDIQAPVSTARASWVTSGAGLVDVQAPTSTVRAGWQPTGSAAVEIQIPASPARASWRPTATAVTDVQPAAATARAAWQATGAAVTVVAAAAAARAAFKAAATAIVEVAGAAAASLAAKASGAAVVDVQAPNSRARYTAQTSAAALTNVQGTAGARVAWRTSALVSQVDAPQATARVAWRTSGTGLTDVQGAATAAVGWKATGAATINVQGAAAALVAWQTAGAATVTVQASASQARVAWLTSGAGAIDQDSGTAQARIAVLTSASGATSAFFWRQDPTAATPAPVATTPAPVGYTPLIPTEPNPLP